MLSKYGTDNIIVMLIIGLAMIASLWYLPKYWISVPLAVLGLILVLFTFWFFRDPDRVLPKRALSDTALVVSPADGKIVEIVDEREEFYIKDSVRRISIFLSPLDVHVNRIPIGGVVEYYNYNPGAYMVAYHPKSSEKNEQSRIGVKTPHGKVFFKQIVGLVARRLVCDLKVGDSVAVGNRFGIMKFGSRMDVMVHLDSEIYVTIGDRVVAGETIIAKIK